MKKAILISISILLLSCANTKTIPFQNDTLMSGGVTEKFVIIIPSNFIKSSSDIKTNLLKKWSYNDDSFIYISLDLSFADSPNLSNWMKCSDAAKKTKCKEGIDESGKYWKEELINNLVVGYKNLPANRKSEFDLAVTSLKKK